MNKRIFLSVMLVTVLVFGMAVVGCETDAEADTWTDVTSLTQVNGTWKGSYTGPAQTYVGSEVITGGTAVMEETMTINATDATTGTMSASQKSTTTYSNITDTQWDSVKEFFSSFAEAEFSEYDITIDVIINDATHTIKMTITVPSQSVSLYDPASGFTGGVQVNFSTSQINQNGTKLKTIRGEGDSVTEIIWTKQ